MHLIAKLTVVCACNKVGMAATLAIWNPTRSIFVSTDYTHPVRGDAEAKADGTMS